MSLRNLGDESRAHTGFTHTSVAHLRVLRRTLTHTLVDLSAGGLLLGWRCRVMWNNEHASAHQGRKRPTGGSPPPEVNRCSCVWIFCGCRRAQLRLSSWRQLRPALSYRSFFPCVSAAHALPMFREARQRSTRKQLEKDRLDPKKSHKPEPPVAGPGTLSNLFVLLHWEFYKGQKKNNKKAGINQSIPKQLKNLCNADVIMRHRLGLAVV